MGTIAKWLRRQIRTKYLFLFEGAGSNPAGVDIILLLIVLSLGSEHFNNQF